MGTLEPDTVVIIGIVYPLGTSKAFGTRAHKTCAARKGRKILWLPFVYLGGAPF